jgi:hypothetical protein
MTVLLPALAVAHLTAAEGIAPVLVSSRRSRSLHLHRLDGGRGRDFATAHAASFTDRGVLRRGERPLCGQRSRRWYSAAIDGRPLCRRCCRAAMAVSSTVNGSRAAHLVSLDDVVTTVVTARTDRDVSAAQLLACNAGYIARRVTSPDGHVLLTRLIAQARTRVGARRSPLGPADRSWGERRLPLASAFPRRVR